MNRGRPIRSKRRTPADRSPFLRTPVELPTDPEELERWLIVGFYRGFDEDVAAARLGRTL